MVSVIYRRSDGLILLRDGLLVAGEAAAWTTLATQPDRYARADLDGVADLPDARTTRVTAAGTLREARADEILAYDATLVAAQSHATSRQKDILATCAVIVRSRLIAAWPSMTPSEKLAATISEADVWKGLREFLDDK